MGMLVALLGVPWPKCKNNSINKQMKRLPLEPLKKQPIRLLGRVLGRLWGVLGRLVTSQGDLETKARTKARTLNSLI